MGGASRRCEIAKVERPFDGANLNDFGLSLEEGKDIQRRLQQELTQFQTDQAAQRDRKCADCSRLRSVHDNRYRTIHTLFGSCRVRVPRCCSCARGSIWRSSAGRVETLLDGRATPELERIQAELGSRLSFREAARVLDIFVPATRPHNHRTVSNRLAKVASQIEKWDVVAPTVSVAPVSLPFRSSSMAPTFARFPAIKAGISRSLWGALFLRAELRVSLQARHISPPGNTILFARRCARKDGCLAETSLSLATERSGFRASSSPQHASPSRIFWTGFIYRCGCGTLSRVGRASGNCKIWMSICKTLRSMCPGLGISSGVDMSERQAKP